MRSRETPDFEAMYRADPDPWEVHSSWYEQRKLSTLMAALPRERYARAWEPGCGVGAATTALARRVDDLVASDLSATAVAETARRVGALDHVRVVRSELPEVPLTGPVDLVVAAEFLYYVEDLSGAFEALWSACAPGAHLVVEHWAHDPHDAHRSGPRTHVALRASAGERGARQVVLHREHDFLLDVYEVPQ